MASATESRDRALETQLAAHLKTRPVYAFRAIGSTMETAHQLAAEGASEGTLVWAERQEQGRGRWGRTWESPPGGLYLSLITRPARPAAETPQLSLVTGLAITEAIQQMTTLFAAIRWPNDLLLGGKKVCGILLEARNGAAVIGIGLNVATNPRELPETATSLRAAGAACDAYQLPGALCARFEQWYDAWTHQGFAPVREALRPWMGLGQLVQIATPLEQLQGQAMDVDESGRLVVRLDSGIQRRFEAGEVTRLR